MGKEEVVRWMDEILLKNPQIRINADRVIDGMWSFADRMRKRECLRHR